MNDDGEDDDGEDDDGEEDAYDDNDDIGTLLMIILFYDLCLTLFVIP